MISWLSLRSIPLATVPRVHLRHLKSTPFRQAFQRGNSQRVVIAAGFAAATTITLGYICYAIGSTVTAAANNQTQPDLDSKIAVISVSFPKSDEIGLARCEHVSALIDGFAHEWPKLRTNPWPTFTQVAFGIVDGDDDPIISALISQLVDVLLAAMHPPRVDALRDSETQSGSPSSATTANSELDEATKLLFKAMDAHICYETLLSIVSPRLRTLRSVVDKAPTRKFDIQEIITAVLGPLKEAQIEALRTINLGFSVLAGLYESDTKMVKVALTGDAKAVLGRPSAAHSYGNDSQISQPLIKGCKTIYDVEVLTSSHVPSNPDERARIAQLHPAIHQDLFIGPRHLSDEYGTSSNGDESTFGSSCSKSGLGDDATYLGLKTTRTFGHFLFKYQCKAPWWLEQEGLGYLVPGILKDGSIAPKIEDLGDDGPPLLTAEPDITTVPIQPGDFIILGSRDLWECSTSEEVVGLVGVWLNERKRERGIGPRDIEEDPSAEYAPSMDPRQSIRQEGYEIETILYDTSSLFESTGSKGGKQISPDELRIGSSRRLRGDDGKKDGWRYAQWHASPSIAPASESTPPPKRFVLEEEDLDSVGRFILRNALGGAHGELRRKLLSMNGEEAREFRNDIRVQVIFFE